ncbi:hypothetical protein L873DRAFT_1795303 [Choiromyces venosus 120613-1]|uniref:Transmembrane protein n=1 Tax=Choiromyces venosus 120613-1 TaxID=1336337 RepID=A0A3N4IX21_9PEZI|nr:hypothetical protein L873DRAFT_1795303 [Choiromyces venosus 120613-1]
MPHSPVIKILAEVEDTCKIPSRLLIPTHEYNPDDLFCPGADMYLEVTIVLSFVSLAVSALFSRSRFRTILATRRKWGSIKGRWSPLNGFLLGVFYLFMMAMVTLALRRSGSPSMSVGMVQLILTLPRFGWWDMLFYLSLGDDYKESAADAVVTELTIMLAPVGFFIDEVVRTAYCDNAYTPIRTPSLIMLVLAAATIAFTALVMCIMIGAREFKRWWMIPLLTVMIPMTFASAFFWVGFLEMTGNQYCPYPDGLAFLMGFQLFFPVIHGMLRGFFGCKTPL